MVEFISLSKKTQMAKLVCLRPGLANDDDDDDSGDDGDDDDDDGDDDDDYGDDDDEGKECTAAMRYEGRDDPAKIGCEE